VAAVTLSGGIPSVLSSGVGGLTTGRGRGNRITTNRLTPFGKGTETQKMKATHNKDREVEWKFPCLGFRPVSGLVVLFQCTSTGTVVYKEEKLDMGYFADTWNMDTFKPLPSTESVTLQND
jgi:hypothetical protein